MSGGTTFLRQLVEVPVDDPQQARQAARVTTALIETIQEVLCHRWASTLHPCGNDTDDEATPFTVYEDPFVLPPGASARRTTPFHSSKAPQITLQDYVTRLFKYMKCSVESYIVALVLVERYHAATGFAVEPMNAFRLYLVSLGVAAKIRDDKFYSNKYYAEVGGISVAEYTALEIKFLFSIKWDTHVDMGDYGALERSILHHILQLTQIPIIHSLLRTQLSPPLGPVRGRTYYSRNPLQFCSSSSSLCSSLGPATTTTDMTSVSRTLSPYSTNTGKGNNNNNNNNRIIMGGGGSGSSTTSPSPSAGTNGNSRRVSMQQSWQTSYDDL